MTEKRSRTCLTFLLMFPSALSLAACTEDPSLVTSDGTTTGTADGTTTGTADGTTTGGSDGADETGGTDTGEEPACAEYPLPFPDGEHFHPYREAGGDLVLENIIPMVNCPNAAVGYISPETAFYVYRPALSEVDDSWPAAELPLVAFVQAKRRAHSGRGKPPLRAYPRRARARRIRRGRGGCRRIDTRPKTTRAPVCDRLGAYDLR